MSDVFYEPGDENDNGDGSALVPMVLAIGVGAAIIALSGGSPVVPPPTKVITLSGSTFCGIGQTQAEVDLSWVSNTLVDVDYDIIRDGVSIGSVHVSAGTPLTWKTFMPTLLQGQSHRYKIIGVQSLVVSNEVTIVTAICGVAPPAELVSGLTADFY